jgi:hypothetical protein
MTYTQQYSFPNVSVRETIIGPTQFTSTWRNVIGVAAPFTKGPLLSKISSRQELVSLYGEDNALGSIAIRQALMQGATNFIVSRAIPSAKGAGSSISFTNPQGAVYSEPLIGATDNRTVGLTVDFSFISEPISQDSSLYAYAIGPTSTSYIKPVTNTDEELSLDFSGIGALVLVKSLSLSAENYDFFLRTTEDPELVTTEDLVTTGFEPIEGSNLATTTGVEVVKVIFPKASITNNNYVQAFQPGMRISSNAGGVTLASPGVIISELIDEDDLNYAFYAKVEVTTAGDGSFKLLIPAGSEPLPVVDIFKVYYRTSQNEYLPGDVIYFGASSTASGSQLLDSPISYLVLNRHDDPGIEKSLFFYNRGLLSEDPATEVPIGITYTVGKTSDTYINVLATTQTINFAKTRVAVGEVDENADGFPNTSLAFYKNKPVLEVLKELKKAIIDDSILGRLELDPVINETDLPYSLGFTIGITGEVGNNIQYTVNRISTNVGTADIEFTDNGVDLFGVANNFVGGVNELIPSQRFFYTRSGNKVLYLESISYGSKVYVNIKPVDESNFILEVREEVPTNSLALPNESFYLSNTGVDLSTGVYPETLSSKLLRAYYVPVIEAVGLGLSEVNFNQVPLRLAPPDEQAQFSDVSFPTHPDHVGAQYLQNISLVGGQEIDPSVALSEDSYVSAIERLNDQDVSIIIAPGVIAGDIRYEKAINALIQQADQATPYNGLRLAVLATPPKLTSSRAEILNSQYATKNLVLVGGYSTLTSARGIGLSQYGPEGFYAGLLATSDTYVSPASSYDNKFIIGASNLDTDGRLSMLDAYTNNNIEMLIVDRVSNKVKFLNGRTTSGDSAYKWVAIVRQTQHLIMNIVRNLEWARSAPNTPQSRARVAAAVDALLKSEQRRGAITGFKPTIVNSSDPERIAQGYMDLVIVWVPVFPADYITAEIIRSISTDFTIQVSS